MSTNLYVQFGAGAIGGTAALLGLNDLRNNKKTNAMLKLAVAVAAIAIIAKFGGQGAELADWKERLMGRFSDVSFHEDNHFTIPCSEERLKELNEILDLDRNSPVAKMFASFKPTLDNCIDYESRYMGIYTDYIDSVSPDDVDRAITWSIDAARRPFVDLKYRVGDAASVITFFQRYTGMSSPLETGSHGNYARCFDGYLFSEPHKIVEVIQKFFEGGKITHIPTFDRCPSF